MGCDIHAYAETYDPNAGFWSIIGELADIHGENSADVYGDQFANPQWFGVDPQTSDRYQVKTFREWKEENPDTPDHFCWNAPRCANPLKGRNYHLFAALAGVRNYDAITPITEVGRRPPDASWQFKTLSTGPDWHSHNYQTLAELDGFDWGSHVRRYRYFDLAGLAGNSRWGKGIRKIDPDRLDDPDSIPHWVLLDEDRSADRQPPVVGIPAAKLILAHLQDEEINLSELVSALAADPHVQKMPHSSGKTLFVSNDKLIAHVSPQGQIFFTGNCLDVRTLHFEDDGSVRGGERTQAYSVYTRVDVPLTYREFINEDYLFEQTLPRLRELAPDGDPDKIRVVYFFDN